MRFSISRVGFLYAMIIIVALAALVQIINLQYFYEPDTEVLKKTTREDPLDCMRGSILADDGRYLAFSIPEYKLCMDCCQATDKVFDAGIDELSKCLADLYKDKKASEYKKLLTSQRANGRRYTVINKKLLTYQEMKRACEFPILREGTKRGGRIVEEYDRRQYPYDKLAYRVLGHIKANESKSIGIEGSCDSILRGTPGVQPMRLTEHNNWIADSEKATIDPIDGTDVQTTIDIDIQDIAERALLKQLQSSSELEAGTTIVMETATGEIKAMVNMRKDKGRFSEDYNYAIGQLGEPGSVFKLATLTLLLDEGKVNLDTKMKAVTSWKYGSGKPFEDHYLRSYDSISVQRGFEISSNNVFRMLAARYWGETPTKFVDLLNDKLKISYNFPFELNGFGKARIKHPNDGSYWSMSDLPQIAMGYTLQITPLHTVNYYNAIANGGVMVKPHLIKNYQKNGIILKEFGTENIATVCKPETAKKLHTAMRAVVEEGTGKSVFNGCKVAVAGKTGTSRVVMPNGKYEMGGLKKHQATFAGFFPYDNPRYTVITVIYSAPTSGNFYGATWAGPVVREIAEELYAKSPEWNTPVTRGEKLPEITPYDNLAVNDTIDGVPSVVGMGLRAALQTLEARGYTVSFSGKGKIREQIPQPGTKTTDRSVRLLLSENFKKDEIN